MQHHKDTANTMTVKCTKGTSQYKIKHRKKDDILGIKSAMRKNRSTLNNDDPAKA